MPGLNLRGDITNNILVGSNDNDTLVGRRGLDTVVGLSGDDLIWGNDDDDRLFGNAGKDSLYGGKNNDTLEGGKDDDQLSGNQGDDVILGNNGNDVVLGGGGNDLVFGGVGNDSIFGNSGNDVLFGGRGNDAIYGGKGNDHIKGDKGDDTIYGDTGADTITGGDGRDVIVLEEGSRAALDTITDFQPAEDAVRLPDGTTYAELVFQPDGAGGTVVRDGRSGKALLVLPGVSSTTLTPENFQSPNSESTPDSGAPQPPATETPQENEDTPDIPVAETDPQPEPDTPVDNTEPEPETPAENSEPETSPTNNTPDPEPETPPTNNTPDPVPNTPPPADPPPEPIPDNQPPIAIDDIATTEFNTAIEISVLNNDTDPDGDALTVIVDDESVGNGTVTTDGTTVTYTPNADFTGIDRVTYTVSDGTDSDTGSIEIEVEPEPVLTAKDDYLNTELNQPIDWLKYYVLDNDINPSDRRLTLTVDENPDTRGSIVTDEWGERVTYIPEPGFRGTDTFTYTISDGIDTDTAVVEVYIPEIEAQDDVIVIPYGTTSVEMDLFSNDVYPEDSHLDWQVIQGPMYGDVNPLNPWDFQIDEFNLAGNPIFTYTLDPDFIGTDTFTYDIGNSLERDEATVTIVTTDAIWIGGDGADPTNWSNPNNWAHGRLPRSDESALIPASAPYQPVLTKDEGIGNLMVEDGASLDISEFELHVDGHLKAFGSIIGYNAEHSRQDDGRINLFQSFSGSSHITLQGTLPSLDTVNVTQPPKIVGTTRIEGDVSGGFDLNGHEVTVTGTFYTSSNGLIMDDPNDVLNIDGRLIMWNDNNEHSQVKAGTINILQYWYDSSINSFRASGTNTVILKGVEQAVRWQQPRYESEANYFQNLEIDIPSIMDFENHVTLENVKVNGTLTLTNGIIRGQKVFINGNLVDNTELGNRELDPWDHPWDFDQSSLQVYETIILAANPHLRARLEYDTKFVRETTLAGNSNLSVKGDLTVQDGFRYYSNYYNDATNAILNLGGNEVSVGGDFNAWGESASLVMADPNDILTVGGKFYLQYPEESQFTAGTLKLKASHPFSNDYSSYSIPEIHTFQASGSHTVSFNGWGRQFIPDFQNSYFSDRLPSYFQNVEIDNGDEVVFEGDTTINGNVILTQGRAISASPGVTVTIGGDMIVDPFSHQSVGEWEVGRTKFTGENPQLPAYIRTEATFTNQVTLPDGFHLYGEMILEETGELIVDGHVSIQDGVTIFMSDEFDGIKVLDNASSIGPDILYIADLDTTASIPEFRSNPRLGPEKLLIRVDDRHINDDPTLRHGAIGDVRFGDDLEIVTRNGTITLGNLNTPDALANPNIVNLTTGYHGSSSSYQHYEGGSLLARNDAGELIGTQFGDRIIGKAEAQIIDGREGKDIISGGAQADTLTGGSDGDIFVYGNPSEGGDTITDFTPSQSDEIQFSSENFGNPTIEFNTIAASTNQATVYATPFSGGTQQVMFDADGNGAAQPVHLATLTNLSVALETGDISGYGAYPL